MAANDISPANSSALSEPMPLDEGGPGDWQVELLTERLAELEFSLEDRGWLRTEGSGADDFSRSGLAAITEQARLYAAKNPLINRAVTLQSMYVFAQGMSVRAKDGRVQDVVDAFMDNRGNKASLTSHMARRQQEEELAITGNLFFSLFVRPTSGQVRVRAIPFEEIVDVFSNPHDKTDVWFYLRRWQERGGGPTWTADGGRAREAWYPDWRYWHRTEQVPSVWGSLPVVDVPVYHVKVGAGPHQRYGLSEVYQAVDWARAYKEFLTDWAALTKALSRFAWKVTTPGGVAARAAAAAKMGRNPAAATTGVNKATETAGTWVASQSGASLEAIPKTGASVSAEDGRRLLLMVCAATGLPETFFGDVSVGTLATANSLDRPTELKFRDRQELWAAVFGDLCEFAVDMAILAGELAGSIEPGEEVFGEPPIYHLAPPEEWKGKPEDKPEEGDRGIDVVFPPILEHDVAEGVSAAVAAVTLNGSKLSDIIVTPEIAARMVLTAAGLDNVEELMDEIFPTDENGNPVLRADQVAREELQAKADAAKFVAAGRVPPPGGPPNNPGEQPPNNATDVRQAAEALSEATRELIRLAEELRVGAA